MKSWGREIHGQQPHIFGQMSVDRVPDSGRIGLVRQIEVHDLSVGMDARVGAARGDGTGRFPAKTAKRPLENGLHRARRVRLDLPSVKLGPDIGHERAVTSCFAHDDVTSAVRSDRKSPSDVERKTAKGTYSTPRTSEAGTPGSGKVSA